MSQLCWVFSSLSVDYSKCTSNGLSLLRRADQPYAVPLVTAATTDEQLLNLAEMDYDHGGSRQSKSGYVRAVTNRYRTPYSDVQKGILETAYIQNWGFITIEKKRYLARQLGLTERQIKVWFQNRRARDRRENKRKVQERRLFGRGEIDKESQDEGADDDYDDEDDDSTEMVIDESANDFVEDEMGEGAIYDKDPHERTKSENETSPEMMSEFSQSRCSSTSTNRAPSPVARPKRKFPGKSSRKDYEPRKHRIEGLAEAMNLKHQNEEALARQEEGLQTQFVQKELPLNFPVGIKIKEEKMDDYDDFKNHRIYEKSGAHDLDTYHAELVRQMTLRNFYEHVSNWAQQSDSDSSKNKQRSPKDIPLNWQRRFENGQLSRAMQNVIDNNFHVDGVANLKDAVYHRIIPNLNGGIRNGLISPDVAAEFCIPPHIIMRDGQIYAQMPYSEHPEKVSQPRPSSIRSLSTSPLQAQESTHVADVPTSDIQESTPLDLSTKSKSPPKDPKPITKATERNPNSSESLTEDKLPRKVEQKQTRTVSFLWKGNCSQACHGFYDVVKL
ncbi:uncharacterized protein LOC144437721 isoform X2 [Glandiceps talaboti]